MPAEGRSRPHTEKVDMCWGSMNLQKTKNVRQTLGPRIVQSGILNAFHNSLTLQ